MSLVKDSLRISEPAFSPPGLKIASVESGHLRGRGDLAFYAPDVARHRDPLPLLVLLHGAYGSFWHWPLRGGAHAVADRMIAAGEIAPMALIMPGDGMKGATTGCVPQHEGDFESWIMQDVIEAAAGLDDRVSSGGPLALAGYSMGGFAALRLAARYASRVRAVASLAAVTHLNQLDMFLSPGSGRPVILNAGDAEVWPCIDAAGAAMPPMRVACGQDDPLFPANRALQEALLESEAKHECDFGPGAHEWSYWAAQLPHVLRFVDKHLKESST